MELIIGVAILIANLIILGLNLKLHTEILKDKSQDKRVRSTAQPKEGSHP
jgi:hypothetical protein